MQEASTANHDQIEDPEVDPSIALEEDAGAAPASSDAVGSDEPAEDVLDVIVPRSEPQVWTLGLPPDEREYVQRELSMIQKFQWFGEVGDVIDKALSGENAMTIGHLFEAPSGMRGGASFDPNSLREADTFLQALSKLVKYAPSFIQDSFVIWLNVPDHEIDWAKEVMKLTKDEGGFSDDETIAIIEAFIDQNWPAIEHFFREKVGQIRKRVQARTQGNESPSSKPSRSTPAPTPSR